AAVGFRRTARVWETGSGQLLCSIDQPQRVDALAFSPDGTHLLTGCHDGIARLWDIDSIARERQALSWGLHEQRHFVSLPRRRAQVLAVRYSPDGRLVATGDAAGEVLIWDAATLQPTGPVLPHAGQVLAIAWSPDGRSLAAGTSGRAARLWSIPGRPAGDP